MLMKRISRSDPERIFIVVKNGYVTAALTNGQCVQWDMTDKDGVNVTIPTTAIKNQAAFAGIVEGTIAIGGYGLIQTYGYHSSVIVDKHASGVPIITGAPLFMSKNAFNLEGPILTSGAGIEETYVENWPVACALAAHTSSNGTTHGIAAFIHAM